MHESEWELCDHSRRVFCIQEMTDMMIATLDEISKTTTFMIIETQNYYKIFI